VVAYGGGTMGLLVTILVTIGGVLALVARELALYARRRAEYSRRRLILRLATATLIVFLLASVLVAVRGFGLDRPNGDPTLFLAFWCCIALLASGILCLAFADMQLVNTELRRETGRQWQEIAELIAARHREQEPDE
jgi:hypothetical protein